MLVPLEIKKIPTTCFWPFAGLDIQTAPRNFKRPKNRRDSSDLDENLTDRIAALKSIISEIFRAARLQKQRFQKFFRASCGLDIWRCLFCFNARNSLPGTFWHPPLFGEFGRSSLHHHITPSRYCNHPNTSKKYRKFKISYATFWRIRPIVPRFVPLWGV